MKRKFSANGVMHVYQRTVSGFNIFYSTEDFIVLYTIISVQARKHGIRLLAACLMIDHVHLLVSAESTMHLSRFVSAYTSQFVRGFNARTGRKGPLFAKAYGSAIKLDDKKIRSAIAYLFNNLVEKQLCRNAEDYKWNFLAYYSPYKKMGAECEKGRYFKRATDTVGQAFRAGRHLNHRFLENIMKGMPADSRNRLTDHIINLYFPFENQELISYYGSYDKMVTAVNSNTGSEYEIAEKHYCKSDVPYREMMMHLKRKGQEDMHDVITLPEDMKRRYMNILKTATSASYTQIMKFLHLASPPSTKRLK